MGKVNYVSEEYCKDLVDQVSDLIQCVDEDGKFVYVNQAWKVKLGYKDAEIKKLSLWEIIHPDCIAKCRKTFQRAFLGERIDFVDTILMTKNGKALYVEGRVNYRFGDKGKIISTMGSFRDVSKQKLAEQKLAKRDHLLTKLSQQTYLGIQRDTLEKQKMVEELRNSHERFDQLAKQSRIMAWEVDAEGLYTYFSQAAQDVIGYSPDELVGRLHFYDLCPEAERESFKKDAFKVFNQKESFVNYVNQIQTKNGDIVIVSTNGIPILDDDGILMGYRGSDTDITEKKLMEQIIVNEKEIFKTTLLSVGDGVISTDNHGNIRVMNPIAERLTGWTQEEAIGKPLEDVFSIVDELTRVTCENPIRKVLKTGEIIKLSNHFLLISKKGLETPIEKNAAPIKNTDGQITGAVIVFRDFSENREKQKQIEYLSFHDYLTGLYNRRYMENAIEKLDKQTNLPLTIMVLDVNGLKLTNDAFGHEVGDRLLKTVADIMKTACRADDIIGRMGGDEFYILLPRTDEIQAQGIKQRIIEATSTAKLDSVIVSLAVGYSVKTSEEENIESIKINADNRMYKDKLRYGKTMRSQTIETVLRNINFKYDQEQIHTERVSQYCEAITKAMNLSNKEINDIKTAGVLHDIGKIMIPPELLNKSEKLTEEEFAIIKRHPETGYQILKSVDEYAALAEFVLYHHERWNGTGYPEGLKGEKIPLQSRIIAVADSYEAMTAKRSYQKSKTKDEARAELEKHAGTQFDPEIVKIFIEKVL